MTEDAIANALHKLQETVDRLELGQQQLQQSVDRLEQYTDAIARHLLPGAEIAQINAEISALATA